MNEAANPLVPTWWDTTWTIIALGYTVFVIIGIVSVVRSQHLTRGQKFIWVLIVWFIPVIGPFAWFMTDQRLKQQAVNR